jgi:hypothetical protein
MRKSLGGGEDQGADVSGQVARQASRQDLFDESELAGPGAARRRP